MKHIKFLTFLFTIFLMIQKSKAQPPKYSDSLVRVKVTQIGKMLSLDERQIEDFLLIEKQQKKSRDSISTNAQTMEQKRDWLFVHLKNYDKQLKGIMNGAQWGKYKAFLEIGRQEFLQKAAQQKIKVEEIKREEL